MVNLDRARIYRLGKEGSWIVAGQIATVVGSLVLVRVLTEYLEPAQYGQLALGLTIAGLVNQVVMGGISNGIGRYYSIADEKNDLSGYLYASRQLMGYSTIVVVAIAVMVTTSLSLLGYSEWLGLSAAAFVFSLLSGYNSGLSGIQNAARQRAVVAFHGGLDAWLKILFAVGVMIWLGSSSTAVLIGYTLSSLIITVSQLFLLKRLTQHKVIRSQRAGDWMQQIWSYSWPFSAFGIFTWAQLMSDRWSLQTFSSTQDVGLYAVIYQLGYAPIGILTGMMMIFLGPILYQRSGDATDSKRNASVHRIAWRITISSILLTLIAFSIAFVLHDWIFGLLVAREYNAVSYLFPWMVLSGGIFAAGQMLALKLMSEMKSTAMMTAKIVTAFVGVILNVFGAYKFGIQGVVFALTIFSIIYFVWMVWLAQHPPTVVNQTGI